MSAYKAEAIVEKVEWEAPPPRQQAHAVSVRVAIPADEFTGLDITRPITITQGPTPDPEPAAWAAPGGDVR